MKEKKDAIELISSRVYTHRVYHDAVNSFSLPQGFKKIASLFVHSRRTKIKASCTICRTFYSGKTQ